MSGSNVRSIESVEVFHAGMVHFTKKWSQAVDETRMLVHRAEEYFTGDQPRYWKHQIQLADRELCEAQEVLAIKRSSVRPEDRPAATEAVMRVRAAERRLRHCEAKKREAKKWALEISRQCNLLRGPLADLANQCEVLLPTAANELRELIEQLKIYADDSKPN